MMIDLPDDIVRTMSIQAVQEGRNLEDVAAEIITRGLAPSVPAVTEPIRHPVKLPLFSCAPDAPASRMTAEDLIAIEQAALNQEDLERLGLPL